MNRAAILPKAARNDPCPCGSGAKFKKCCGDPDRDRRVSPAHDEDMSRSLRAAKERYRAGCLPEAEALLGEIVRIDPRNVEALHLLALIAEKRGDDEVAIERMRHALGIQPASAVIHNHLGQMLCRQGRLREGMTHFERAIILDGSYVDAHNNLGNALSVLDRLAEAEACYRLALELRPDDAAVQNNLGNTLSRLGRISEAIPRFLRVLELRPGSASAHNNLGNAFVALGRVREAVAHYERVLELRPDDAVTNSNLLFAFNCSAHFDSAAVFAAHRRYAERFEAPLISSWPRHTNDRSPDRPLRIGYVSSDLRMHSVAWFIEPVLANHDRERFEVYAYHGHEVEDEVSRRLRSHVTQWRTLVGLSDEEIARGIREDGIDILVDLNGHTAMNRLPVFARKPAPVQVTWLGYPNTTGLAAMDYRLTDRYADPPGMTERYHTEMLWRLPESFSCYRPPDAAPEVGDLPCGEHGVITFGSFNNRTKIGPETIALWARVLHSEPGSRLMLKGTGFDSEAVQEALRDAFRVHGIGDERLQLLGGRDSHAEHLRRYHAIDIALDPFPYNGTTTTLDALWMGVPVVTLEGQTHVSRVGVSLLTHLGLTEWIARSADEYVEIAARWAAREQRLAALRRELRARMVCSPLTDAPAFTRHLESAYRAMWERWCRAA
jgi:predicted O-linked N-acetylglucosamine transferase (SPINDLY family)